MSDYVRMTIAIPKDAYARLRDLAQRDMRQPRQQAHWLLYQSLGLVDLPQETRNRGAMDSDPQHAAVAP